VSKKANGAVGPAKDHHDAADGRINRSTPSDAEALAALLILRAWLGAGSSSGAPALYTQYSPPPDVASDDAFARVHRSQMRAGVPGWTKAGSVRSVTAGAWRAYVSAQTEIARSRPKRTAPHAPAPANDADAKIDAALGIRTLRAAR